MPGLGNHVRGVRAAVIATALVIAVALVAWLPARRSSAVTPAYRNIISGEVIEMPPIDPTDTATRQVIVRLVIEAAPDCNTSPTLVYGALIDSDRTTSTGTKITGIPNFGADARISAECVSGSLVSPGRTVNVTVDGGTGNATIDIQTTVGELPSVYFKFAPYAQEGTSLEHVTGQTWGVWTITEKRTG